MFPARAAALLAEAAQMIEIRPGDGRFEIDSDRQKVAGFLKQSAGFGVFNQAQLRRDLSMREIFDETRSDLKGELI